MQSPLALAAFLFAFVASASAQDAGPDSTYGEPLPAVVPDSLRPAPGPEPRTPPPSTPVDSSAASDSADTALAGATSASAVRAPLAPGDPEPAAALAPGTTGHAVEIVVANGSRDLPMDGVHVVAVSVPEWVDLPGDQGRVGTVAAGGEAPVRFAFSVARGAPVGAGGTLAFDVVDGRGAVLATRQFAVVVAPPVELALDLPRPNPSRGAVTVPFALPAAARVTVEVVDVLGRRVAVLVDGDRPAGLGEATLAAGALAPGTYVVRLAVEADGRREQRVRRLTVVR